MDKTALDSDTMLTPVSSLHDDAIRENNERNEGFKVWEIDGLGEGLRKMEAGATKAIAENLTEADKENRRLKQELDEVYEQLHLASDYARQLIETLGFKDTEEIVEEKPPAEQTESSVAKVEQDMHEKDLRELYDEYKVFLIAKTQPSNRFRTEDLERQYSDILSKIDKRNIKKDLARLHNLEEDEISLSIEDARQGDKKYHFGPLFIGKQDAETSFSFPEIVDGPVKMEDVRFLLSLTVPKKVFGFALFPSLEEVGEFKGNIEEITGSFDIRNYKFPENFPLSKDCLIGQSDEESDSVTHPCYVAEEKVDIMREKYPDVVFEEWWIPKTVLEVRGNAGRSGGYN